MAGPAWPWWLRAAIRRRSLFWSTAEGVLAAASDNFAVPYLPLYAVAMGAGPLEVSLVTAVPALVSNVLQLPFGRLAERAGANKPLWLAGNTAVRFLWIPIAALPWVVRDRSGLIAAYVALLGLRAVFAAMAVPAWTAIMGGLTHRSWRGHYFALRNVLANVAALAAAVGAGRFVQAWGYPAGYAAAFGAAWLVGALSLLAILPIEEPGPSPRAGRVAGSRTAVGGAGSNAAGAGVPARGAGMAAAGRPDAWDRAGSWLAGGPARWRQEAPGFYEFALSSVLWNFAVNLPAALFAVYFTRDLKGSAQLWGIANGAVFLTTVLGQRRWGWMCDRLGQPPVLLRSGLWAAFLPLCWALVPSPEWVVAINLVGGYVWAGYNLAAFNLVLEVTPARRRPTYVGLFNTGVGLASAIGPVAGGWLAEQLGIPPVMVVSALLRLTALALFARWSGTALPGRLRALLRRRLPVVPAGNPRVQCSLTGHPAGPGGVVPSGRLLPPGGLPGGWPSPSGEMR